MRKTLLVTNLIVLAWLSGSTASAQRAGDSKTTSLSASFSRAQLLLSLIDSKQDDAPAKLKQALSDESWYVRGQAARGLARLGDRSAAPALVSLLQDESW